MKQRKGDQGAYTFTRAAYDELRTSEVSYNVKWTVQLTSSFQKGIWDVIVTVDPLVGRRARPAVTYTASWPNSNVQTFEAFLYGCMHRTARMVEDWATDIMKHEARRQ